MEDSIEDILDPRPGEAPQPEPVAEPPLTVAPEPVEPTPAPVPPVEPAAVEPSTPPVEPTPAAAPTPAAPAPTAPAPPADPKDAEIAELRQMVQGLRDMVEKTAAATLPTEAPTPAAPAPPAPQTIKFLEKEEELDTVLNSVENFNAFMTKVVNQVKEETIKETMLSLPTTVQTLSKEVVAQQLAVNEFYSNNKDLLTKKAFVGMVANEIAAKNPDWNMEKIIEELGPEVRTRLALVNAAAPLNPGAPNPATPPAPGAPAFVPGSPSRPGPGAGQLTQLEKEIAELTEGML